MLIMTFMSQVATSVSTTGLIVGAALAAIGLAGILLGVRRLEHDRRVARWCFAFWLTQILVFALPSLSYSFSCGAIVPLSFEFPFGLSIGAPRLGVQFVARLAQEGDVSYIGVNLIALAACRFFMLEWRNSTRSGGGEAPRAAL